MSGVFAGGPVVLDSEALSRLGRYDRYLHAVVEQALSSRSAVVTAAPTVVEAFRPDDRTEAMSWALSKIRVVEVTRDTARAARDLLGAVGKHGHSHALDALLVATALALPGHPTIFTSDPEDITALADSRASVVPLR